jgi:hydrogenase-4 component B
VTLIVALARSAGLLALAAVAVAIGREAAATRFVYGASTAIAATSLVAAAAYLVAGEEPASLVLPLGIPWLGSHFRLDALSAFFLLVIDLGALSASLFALGYGARPSACCRSILPFLPA